MRLSSFVSWIEKKTLIIQIREKHLWHNFLKLVISKCFTLCARFLFVLFSISWVRRLKTIVNDRGFVLQAFFSLPFHLWLTARPKIYIKKILITFEAWMRIREEKSLWKVTKQTFWFKVEAQQQIITSCIQRRSQVIGQKLRINFWLSH